jgi:hypothetical protein
MSIGPYLYRGTTAGWPGNSVLQEEQITCTSTDPLVATLFAIECRNHGHAIILVIRKELFDNVPGPPNYFSISESAVNLRIEPAEIARRAEVALDVDESLWILRELGFEDIPVRLRGRAALQQELDESHAAGLRLNEEQIALFNRRMFETGS